MTNKLKTFAITMVAAGATVVAHAAVLNTNTFTNVIQDIQVSLTVYSNAPVKSSTSQTGEKPVTLTTKTIIAALSNAAPTIPSLVGFNWGKSPQLVIDTVFSSTNVVSNTVTVFSSNTVAGTTNTAIAFTNTTTNIVQIPDTNGSVTITNNTVGTNGGTNVITAAGSWTTTLTNISINSFAYTNSTGAVTNSATFPTSVGVWTVITAVSNAGTTNIVTTTYTNVPHTTVEFSTNVSNVEVQGGTATAPTFANVSSYVGGSGGTGVIIVATGTGLGTTNAVFETASENKIKGYSLGVYSTTAGTPVGDNLSLDMSGFSKAMFKQDVLVKTKLAGTNEVPETTSTTTVAGSGFIGGTFVTNANPGTNVWSNYTGLYATQYTISSTNTNAITGTITNPIPVVVEGTVTIGAPKAVAQ